MTRWRGGGVFNSKWDFWETNWPLNNLHDVNCGRIWQLDDMKLNSLIFQGVSNSPLRCELWTQDWSLDAGSELYKCLQCQPRPNSRTQKGGRSGSRLWRLQDRSFGSECWHIGSSSPWLSPCSGRKSVICSHHFPIKGRNVALSKRVWSKSYWFLPSADLARWMHFVLIRATRSAMVPLPRSTRPWSSFVKTADSSTKSSRRWSRVTPWQEMVQFLKYSRAFSIISTSRGKCFRLRVVWWGHLWRGCC